MPGGGARNQAKLAFAAPLLNPKICANL